MLIAVFAALMFVFLLVASDQPSPSGGIPQGQHETNPADKRSNAQRDQRGTADAPFFVQLQQPPGHNGVASQTQNEGDWYARPDWWVAGFTGGLVIATSGLWIFTAFLWGSTKRLVSGSEMTAERQLRAYVFVTQVRVIDPDSDNPSAEIMIKNTGQTPAYKVTVEAAANRENFPPGIVIFTPTPVGPNTTRFVLGPEGTGMKTIPLTTLLNAEVMQGMRDGRAALYLWGEILYTDAFKKSFRKPRFTQFRFMIGGSGGWPSSNLMVVCAEGNDADENASLS
jgi:hypothetical protein